MGYLRVYVRGICVRMCGVFECVCVLPTNKIYFCCYYKNPLGKVWFNLVSLFNGISNFVGYLMPTPSLLFYSEQEKG